MRKGVAARQCLRGGAAISKEGGGVKRDDIYRRKNSWGGGEVGNEEMSFGRRGRERSSQPSCSDCVWCTYTHFHSSELLTQRKAKVHLHT